MLQNLKAQFPIFDAQPNYCYLDNAATTHKPQIVIEALSRFMATENATIHRGVYSLSQQATQRYSMARKRIQRFLGAAFSEEIIFTRGTTESLNMLAYGLQTQLKENSQILISEIEHHANWVPWQRVAKLGHFKLKTIPVLDSGICDLNALKKLLEEPTALVSVGYLSNVLGVRQPVEEIIALAKKADAIVGLDGAQSSAHLPVDVAQLDCDFYCFSGHKLYGPTGIGILYVKKHILEKMQPFMLGGDMIDEVFLEKTSFAPLPNRFEAGTPAIAEAIALATAIDFLEELGLENLKNHEKYLTNLTLEMLNRLPGVKVLADPKQLQGIISFVLDGIHPHDVGTILDEHKIAIRAGHHCSQPTMRRFGVGATNRVSFACYNTSEDIERLEKGLRHVQEIFL